MQSDVRDRGRGGSGVQWCPLGEVRELEKAVNVAPRLDQQL